MNALRLWDNVKIEGADDCWYFQGYLLKGGYGSLTIDGRSLLAHRAAWEIANGAIPTGMRVCHRCDNPPCVNPRHLFLGTQRQNIMDAVEKGRIARGINHGLRKHPERIARGERHSQAKLTSNAVRSIRVLLAAGAQQKDVAPQFGISASVISSIARGITWRCV